MEYRPHYAQPFTLQEAMGLDVSIITDEIARLRNSLKHLQETQEMLRNYQSTEAPENADPEVQRALDENEVVIGSQTERISILKMALTEKGVLDNSHYESRDPERTSTAIPPMPRFNSPQDTMVSQASERTLGREEVQQDGGIYL